MNELKISKLIASMEAAPAGLRERVLEQSSAAISLMSSSGAKRGINEQTDIHGRAYLPLKHPHPSGGTRRLRNKGLLLASISATMEHDVVILSANSPGARIQNDGGVVRPKKGKALSIPITRQAERAGSPRRFPRKLFFLAARNAGTKTVGTLCEVRKEVLTVYYVLVTEVVIPPTPYLGWSAPTLESIANLLADNYAKEIIKLFDRGII